MALKQFIGDLINHEDELSDADRYELHCERVAQLEQKEREGIRWTREEMDEYDALEQMIEAYDATG
jgi:hypothetical protein